MSGNPFTNPFAPHAYYEGHLDAPFGTTGAPSRPTNALSLPFPSSMTYSKKGDGANALEPLAIGYKYKKTGGPRDDHYNTGTFVWNRLATSDVSTQIYDIHTLPYLNSYLFDQSTRQVQYQQAIKNADPAERGFVCDKKLQMVSTSDVGLSLDLASLESDKDIRKAVEQEQNEIDAMRFDADTGIQTHTIASELPRRATLIEQLSAENPVADAYRQFGNPLGVILNIAQTNKQYKSLNVQSGGKVQIMHNIFGDNVRVGTPLFLITTMVDPMVMSLSGEMCDDVILRGTKRYRNADTFHKCVQVIGFGDCNFKEPPLEWLLNSYIRRGKIMRHIPALVQRVGVAASNAEPTSYGSSLAIAAHRDPTCNVGSISAFMLA